MADIEKYGDLNDKELLEFLAEVKSEDEDIEEAKAETEEKIKNEEAQSELVELPENAEIEAYYGNDAWRRPPIYTGKGQRLTILHGPEGSQRIAERNRRVAHEKAQKLKEDRIRIQREAFSQDRLKLSEQIDKSHIKLLISLLVKEHTQMVDKYSGYINKRLTTLLSPLIPRQLRICKMAYPNSIKLSPGFLYKASEEYGNGLTFWATPSIPYYFEQGTEQKMLAKSKSEFLCAIDRAVSSYHEHYKKRQDKELKYASLIIQKNVQTYFDLLKLNPFWFETLYNKLKDK